MSENLIEKCVKESIEVKSKIVTDRQLITQLAWLADTWVKSLQIGGKIIFCGN